MNGEESEGVLTREYVDAAVFQVLRGLGGLRLALADGGTYAVLVNYVEVGQGGDHPVRDRDHDDTR